MFRDQMTSHELQQWAARCDDAANNPRITGDERARLFKMKLALLDLAQQQEWLERRNADTRPEQDISLLTGVIAREAARRR